jgi:RNA-directed DNA polymerase
MSLIATLALDAGLSVRDVTRIVASAPKRYFSYPIKKRDGTDRLIAQPAFELKALQRLLMMRVLSQFPVHDAAYAYVKGRSIRQNALRHVQSNFILKLDFKNFFPSIRPIDLERLLINRPPIDVSPKDFEVLYQLLFWGEGSYLPRCLSIGAPSSPMISNILMYDFDRILSEVAADLGLTYTRYADDLTVSGPTSSKLMVFERKLDGIIKDVPLSLTLNDEKRGLYGRGERRMVTGLIITPDHKISIGRERKREIRAAVNRYKIGELDDRGVMRCKGLLAFVVAAEPSFLGSLVKTYGRDTIRGILRTPPMMFYRPENEVFNAGK